METKFCPTCEETKSVDEFYRHRDKGLYRVCKSCHKIRSAKRAKEIPELYRTRNLQSRFGISREFYKLLHEVQGGVCAICRQPETVKGRDNLAVDHNHETDEVRGLLCHSCNTGLGKFKDDPELLQRAISYLTEGLRSLISLNSEEV